MKYPRNADQSWFTSEFEVAWVKTLANLTSIVGIFILLGTVQSIAQNTFPATGNVGIGTTTPQAALQIAPSSYGTGSALFLGNPAAGGYTGLSLDISAASGGYALIQSIQSSGFAYGNLILNPNAGNVGIGTTVPNATLAITHATGTYQEGDLLRLNAVNGGPGNGAGILFTNNNDILNMARIAASDDGSWGGHLLFSTAPGTRSSPGGTPAERMRITDAGNVGIGTTTPHSALEVNGNVTLTPGANGGGGASVTYSDGTVQSTAWNGTTLGGDYAEAIDVLGDRAGYEPGDVIVINAASPGRFEKSSKAYSKLVAGVYSTKPGLVGRRLTFERVDKAAEVPMAMLGIVPTKVTTENGPVKPGDLLVTAIKAGYAMRGTDKGRLIGAVLGKALAPLSSGDGVIEVMISIQ